MEFDVLVIGGGHAGIEAATAAARIGVEVALITLNPNNLGELSCNPSIGGVAKGIIVKEVDALDGVMGRAIDKAGIHFKILNSSKGPAVWGPRAQADRKLYKAAINEIISEFSNIKVIIAEVTGIEVSDNKIIGVSTSIGAIKARAVVVTTGTFMNGKMHIGTTHSVLGGRVDEPSSVSISESLRSLGIQLKRLKTGTPARILASSIDYSMMEAQVGDAIPNPFSFMTQKVTIPQIACYITYTTDLTHQIIRDNLKSSAMYSGTISSVGPRYCPSIEDKVVKFSDKNRHQVFLEPEGLDSDVIYPNGISTSLPEEIQDKFIRSIPGLENCSILKYGYAVEYDFADPRQLDNTLEVRTVKGLFFAGQINGTTGYEEAAGQGLVAGSNAALKSLGKSPLILDRSNSYIGVMIDDLIVHGVMEPYRVMTSRAEFRILLRPDNAHDRLLNLGKTAGLISTARANKFAKFFDKRAELMAKLSEKKACIGDINIQYGFNFASPQGRVTLKKILSMPQFSQDDAVNLVRHYIGEYEESIIESTRVSLLYDSYSKRLASDLNLLRSEAEVIIPPNINWDSIKSLSNEARERIRQATPRNVAQLKSLPGLTPASIIDVIIYLRKAHV